MTNLSIALYSFSQGAFIMVGIFAVVCIAIVGAIFLLMGTDKTKKETEKNSEDV